MRATVIHLYRGSVDSDSYCGSFHVACPDGDPRIADLHAVGCGRWRGDDGMCYRSFFFADEIEEMVAKAERETECVAVIDEEWPYPRGERDA